MRIILITTLSIFISFANAQNHDHHAGHSKKAETKQDIHQQFKPTKDLKIRMEKILGLMKDVSKKKEDLKSVRAYGIQLTETVNDIFKTCQLEPDADVAIHPSLGLLLEGAEDLKNGKYESGHKKIHDALLDYGKLFQHEGWKL